ARDGRPKDRQDCEGARHRALRSEILRRHARPRQAHALHRALRHQGHPAGAGDDGGGTSGGGVKYLLRLMAPRLRRARGAIFLGKAGSGKMPLRRESEMADLENLVGVTFVMVDDQQKDDQNRPERVVCRVTYEALCDRASADGNNNDWMRAWQEHATAIEG